MVGQTISQCSWSFINQMPGKIATQWFTESEISLATSIAVSGWLVGCALGMIYGVSYAAILPIQYNIYTLLIIMMIPVT